MNKEETNEIRETLKSDIIINKVIAGLCLMGVVAAFGAFWDVQNLKANQSHYKNNIEIMAREIKTLRLLQCEMIILSNADSDNVIRYCAITH